MSGKSEKYGSVNKKAKKVDDKKDVVKSLKIKLGIAQSKIEELENRIKELKKDKRDSLFKQKAKLRKVGLLK